MLLRIPDTKRPSFDRLLATMADDIEAASHPKIAPAEESARLEAEQSLYTFIKTAWPYVEPHRQYVDNWHIGAVAEHLEAVWKGQIKNLLINQPPATTKSLTVSVLFPAWIWLHSPWWRFLCVSYDQSLSTGDNMRMRALVESEWYQARWPQVKLSVEQNQKTRYDTTAGGWRIGTSIGGRILGVHPHLKICDDPHNPKKQLLSEAEIQQAAEMWDYGLSTRGATLNAPTILLMQRLHQRDLSGHVLERPDDWVHLVLPMRYEPGRMVTTPIGWADPRREPGELLWPAEWTEERVRAVGETLGSWGVAGQFQQRPAPTGGLLFRRDWFKTIETTPADLVAQVRFWDVAGTEGGSGPRTAGVRMGRTRDGRYVVLDVIKGRWGPAGVDRVLAQTAAADGRAVAIREEQEPGSSGKAIVAARARLLVGYDYGGIPATGDKVLRAQPFRAQAEAGNVFLYVRPDGTSSWVADFLDELELFPAGAIKDQVDATSSALSFLAMASPGSELSFYGGNGMDPVIAAERTAQFQDKYDHYLAAYVHAQKSGIMSEEVST